MLGFFPYDVSADGRFLLNTPQRGRGAAVFARDDRVELAGRAEALDVQSRHVVERIQSESLGLLCPELTNPLERREPAKALEALRKVVRIEEGGQMRAKARMGGVEEPADGCVLDGAIHPFDLAVGPRMIEFREAMVDAVLGAGEVKGVGPKALTGRRASPESRRHVQPPRGAVN